jgi:hypothetical protein
MAETGSAWRCPTVKCVNHHGRRKDVSHTNPLEDINE